MFHGMAHCRCTSPRPAEVPSLSDLVVPQLAALAAEAAAAAAEPAASTAPYVAASRRPARSEAEREPCSWFKCPISLVSAFLHHQPIWLYVNHVCEVLCIYELICILVDI